MDEELEQAFLEQFSSYEENHNNNTPKESEPVAVRGRGGIPLVYAELDKSIEMELKRCCLEEVIEDVVAIWFKFVRYREGEEFHIGEFKNWIGENEDEIAAIRNHPRIKHNFDYAKIEINGCDILIALLDCGVLKTENGVGKIGMYVSFNTDNAFGIKKP